MNDTVLAQTGYNWRRLSRKMSPKVRIACRLGALLTLVALLIPGGHIDQALGQARTTGQPGAPQPAIPVRKAFAPRIDAEEIDHIARTFDVDDEQREVLDSLFSSFDPEAHRAYSAALKQEIFLRQALREDSRGTVILMQRMADSNLAWRAEREELEKQFFEDVRSILTPDQLDHWASYERGHRRRWVLAHDSELGGEGVDLIALTGEVVENVTQRESVDPTLDSYAENLDQLITARTRTLHEIERATAQGQMSESGRMGPLFDRLGRERVAIVRHNRETVDLLANSLDETTGRQLEREFEHASYPNIFADTQADLYFDLVYALDDLSESQIASLETISLEYDAGLAPINHELVDLHFKKQDVDPLGEIKDGLRTDSSSSDLAAQLSQRIHEVQGNKKKFVDRFVQRILDVLTPDQRERLPEPDIAPQDRVATLIDAALDFVVTDLDLPEGADRREFIATIRHALRGLNIRDVTIAMPHVTPDGRTEIPVTGATEDGQTVTIPIELKDKAQDEKGDGGGG